MSAYDLTSLFDVVQIKRTDLIGDALNTVVAFLSGPERAPEDPLSEQPGEDESAEVDWWQHYGFLSRPPSGAEALVVRLGAQTFALASRYLAARGFGKLGEGDVAIYSVGGNVIRLNANGSISVLAPDKNGKKMLIRLDPKGEMTFMLGNKAVMQLSETSGFTVSVPNGNITFAAPAGAVQVMAQSLNNLSPVFKANAAGSTPLAPTSANPGVFV